MPRIATWCTTVPVAHQLTSNAGWAITAHMQLSDCIYLPLKWSTMIDGAVNNDSEKRHLWHLTTSWFCRRQKHHEIIDDSNLAVSRHVTADYTVNPELITSFHRLSTLSRPSIMKAKSCSSNCAAWRWCKETTQSGISMEMTGSTNLGMSSPVVDFSCRLDRVPLWPRLWDDDDDDGSRPAADWSTLLVVGMATASASPIACRAVCAPLPASCTLYEMLPYSCSTGHVSRIHGQKSFLSPNHPEHHHRPRQYKFTTSSTNSEETKHHSIFYVVFCLQNTPNSTYLAVQMPDGNHAVNNHQQHMNHVRQKGQNNGQTLCGTTFHWKSFNDINLIKRKR